jgi:hypothetical protein
MAGKIVADQIQHSSEGTVGTQYVVNGVAKAWVNIEGEGTIAVRDSFNNSSIVDRADGRYTTTVTNAMNNANYSVFYTGQKSGASDDGYVLGGIGTGGITATAVQITTQIGSSGPDDIPTVNVANHGDLA